METNVEAARPRTALVTGVANKQSIAWAIAKALADEGYEICLTHASARLKEDVESLASTLPKAFTAPLDVTNDVEVARIGETLAARWASLDALVHSIAFANREDLGGRFVNLSRGGFRTALEVSAYSLVSLTHAVLPLLESARGSVVTLSYLGGQKVIPNYNVMGVAKAALEMSAKYLAADLGPSGVRVNVLSPGPIKTFAARAISNFSELLGKFEEKAPLRRLITTDEVASTAAFLLSEKSAGITGQVIFIDGGYEILGY